MLSFQCALVIHYIGTSEFRTVTCLLQSSTLNSVTVWLLIIVPILSFLLLHKYTLVSQLCLMLISVAFIVGRIRALVYSERNQLSQSVIALLFKQCLGPLQLKQTKKNLKIWFCTYGYLSFLFNRVFSEMATDM